MLIVILLASLCVQYGALPETRAMLYGMKPVSVAVVLHALIRLQPSVLKTPLGWTIGMGDAALSLFGIS